MSDSLREIVAQAINQTAQTHGQHGQLRARPLSDGMATAMADAALAAIETAGWRLLAPEEPNEPPMKPVPQPKIGKREMKALEEIRRFRDGGHRHCWRRTSAQKLMAHGLVTFEPGSTQYWDITAAGREALATAPKP